MILFKQKLCCSKFIISSFDRFLTSLRYFNLSPFFTLVLSYGICEHLKPNNLPIFGFCFLCYTLIILLFRLLLSVFGCVNFVHVLILAKINYLIELVCFLWVISYPENTNVDIFSSLFYNSKYFCNTSL